MLAGAWHFIEIGVGTAENGTFEVSERDFTSGHIYTTLSPSLLECFNVSGEILSNVKQPTSAIWNPIWCRSPEKLLTPLRIGKNNAKRISRAAKPCTYLCADQQTLQTRNIDSCNIGTMLSAYSAVPQTAQTSSATAFQCLNILTQLHSLKHDQPTARSVK